jgi:hypothetical protein
LRASGQEHVPRVMIHARMDAAVPFKTEGVSGL